MNNSAAWLFRDAFPHKRARHLFLTLCLISMTAWGDSAAQAGEADWIVANQTSLEQIGNFEIYGYFPRYRTNFTNSLDYANVTDAAYFSIGFNSNGALSVDAAALNRITALHTQADVWNTKVHVGVLGLNGSSDYVAVSADPAKRQTLANNLASFLQTHQLEGVTFDWEYPNNGTEENNYAALLNTVKTTLNPDYEVGYSPHPYVPLSYGSQFVNKVNRVQAQAYGPNFATNGSYQQGVDTVNAILGAGFRPDEIQLGIPFYAVPEPGKGAVPIDFRTFRSFPNYRPNLDVVTAPSGVSYRMGSKDTIRRKVRHAIDQGLAGVMIWELGQDEFFDLDNSLHKVVSEEVNREFQRPHRPFDGANTIGVNFQGTAPTSMGPNEAAGLAAQRYWNNLAGASGSEDSIKDGHNATTSISIEWRSNNTWRTGLKNIQGERRLMNGYLDTSNTSTTTVDVEDIPYASYYVIGHHDGANLSASRTGDYSVNAGGQVRTVSLTDAPHETFRGRFESPDANKNGNYTVFGIYHNQSSFMFSATGGASSTATKRAAINGLQIIDVSNRISLSNIVAGGDGFGAETEKGLTGAAGASGGNVIRTDPEAFVHGSSFPSYANVPYAYVDRAFTPSGDWAGFYQQPIDSDNHHFRFGIDAGVGGPYGTIYSGWGAAGNPNHAGNSGLNAMASSDSISFGAQNGITFDLDAIRADNLDKTLTAFAAIVGDNRNVSGGSIDYFVLLDGELMRWDIDLTDTEQFIYLKIADADRFLTLAITDSADGIANDRGYFANAHLLYDGGNTPEPGTLTLLGAGAMLLLRRRGRAA